MIPAEAVEAAAKVTRDVCEAYDPGGWAAEEKFTEWARMILEAAAPYMLAEAWEAGYLVAKEAIRQLDPINPHMLNTEGEK